MYKPKIYTYERSALKFVFFIFNSVIKPINNAKIVENLSLNGKTNKKKEKKKKGILFRCFLIILY